MMIAWFQHISQTQPSPTSDWVIFQTNHPRPKQIDDAASSFKPGEDVEVSTVDFALLHIG